jgi:hypothetical protein
LHKLNRMKFAGNGFFFNPTEEAKLSGKATAI